MALPLLEPGKSLRFALLPEGQDPDDLARSAGGQAIARVLDGASPLVEILWTREVEAGPLDTPERKAIWRSACGRCWPASATKTCASITGPRWRRACASSRPAAAAMASSPARSRAAMGRAAAGRASRPAGAGRAGATLGARAASQASRCGRRRACPAARSSPKTPTVSPREALILAALVAHPDLLASQAEALLELDLAHPDTNRLRQALVDLDADRAAGGADVSRETLELRGIGPLLARVEAAVRPGDRWCLELRSRSRRSEGKPSSGHDLASQGADAT